jgi:Holliday junction resolvase RusA-like endonuclease
MQITLKKPPTTNHIYGLTAIGGHARMYITKEGKAWFEEAAYDIKKQYKKRHPIEVECEVWVNVYTSTSRDADASNKPILDALEHNGVIVNDKLFYGVHAMRYKCKKGEDRVEVEIMGY